MQRGRYPNERRKVIKKQAPDCRFLVDRGIIRYSSTTVSVSLTNLRLIKYATLWTPISLEWKGEEDAWVSFISIAFQFYTLQPRPGRLPLEVSGMPTCGVLEPGGGCDDGTSLGLFGRFDIVMFKGEASWRSRSRWSSSPLPNIQQFLYCFLHCSK